MISLVMSFRDKDKFEREVQAQFGRKNRESDDPEVNDNFMTAEIHSDPRGLSEKMLID